MAYKIAGPRYTQTPNLLYDLMPHMKQAELRICFAIARATFGWHKRQDKLSYTQLEEMTGLSRQGVADGLKQPIAQQIITREKSGQSFLYGFDIVYGDEEDAGDALPSSELIMAILEDADIKQSSNLTSQVSRPEVVKKVDYHQSSNLTHKRKGKKGNKEHDDDGARACEKEDPLSFLFHKKDKPYRSQVEAELERISNPEDRFQIQKLINRRWRRRVTADDAGGLLEEYDPIIVVAAVVESGDDDNPNFGYLRSIATRLTKQKNHESGSEDTDTEKPRRSARGERVHGEGKADGRGGYNDHYANDYEKAGL